jgi:membrane fusion protein, adhesin transport system
MADYTTDRGQTRDPIPDFLDDTPEQNLRAQRNHNMADQDQSMQPVEKKPRRADPTAPAEDSYAVGKKRLAQSLMLEEEGPGGIIRVAAFVIVIFLGCFIVWSSYTRITEVVVSSGEVSPVGSVKKVQHLEGGIIKTINVKDGDIITKGDVIMELEPTGAMPERDQLLTRLTALSLEAEQLRAFSTGQTVDHKEIDERYKTMVTSQANIFEAKRMSVDAQINVIEKQIAEKISEIALLRGQEGSIKNQIALLNEQIGMRMELMRRGLQPKLVMLDNQRELARTEGQMEENKGQQRRVRKSIAELESRKDEINTRMVVEATESLGKIYAEIAELEESINQVEDKVSRLHIRSPVTGVIQNLQTETVGGVLAPGEVVVEVIPTDAELVVEARITTDDIGFVFKGQTATVKVMTYDYTRYGLINGVIERISATTLVDETGNPFYRANIRLEKNHVGDEPGRNLVVPGMTVIADIKTGDKTLSEYLLKPIYKAFNEAFRER